MLSDAEYKRCTQATEAVDDSWIKKVDAKGGNGRALLKKYND